jgi:hypothetical protein
LKVAARVFDGLVAERLDQLRAVEHAQPLPRAEPVLHVAILENLAQAAPAAVLTDDVRGDALLGACSGKEKRERRAQQDRESLHSDDCILATVRRKSTEGRFAERVVHWVDDAGAAETIVIWIERKQGAVWAVGRAVNLEQRSTDEPRQADYLFEGFELEDALEAANEALEDDLSVSESDGHPEKMKPFTRDELLKPLERWFFGRR